MKQTQTAKTPHHYALFIATSKNNLSGSSSNASLLRRVKSQHYSHENMQWHIIFVLPSLLSYAYMDFESYDADWKKAMAYSHTLSFALKLSLEQVEFIHGKPKKIIRAYKKEYPTWTFIAGRPFLERVKITTRWQLRKSKRQILGGWSSLKKSFLLQNKPEDYLNFLFPKP